MQVARFDNGEYDNRKRYNVAEWDGIVQREHIKDIIIDRIGDVGDDYNEWVTQISDYSHQTNGFIVIDTQPTKDPTIKLEDIDDNKIIEKKRFEIIGVGICTVGTVDWFIDYINHPDINSNDINLDDELVGCIHMICLSDGYCGNGIGRYLMQAQIEYLDRYDIDSIMTCSWRRHGKPDSANFLKQNGFENIHHMDDFYATLGQSVPCVDCGDRCECGSTIFRREVD